MFLEELMVLKGKYFVIIENGNPNAQGYILDFISKDFVKVLFFEWVTLYDRNKEIIPFKIEKFRFFDTDDEMVVFLKKLTPLQPQKKEVY